MTRYVPVVAFVAEEDVATLQPLVNEWAAAYDRTLDRNSKVFLRMSGATYEHVAWGRMVSSLARLVRDEGYTVDMVPAEHVTKSPEPEERG